MAHDLRPWPRARYRLARRPTRDQPPERRRPAWRCRPLWARRRRAARRRVEHRPRARRRRRRGRRRAAPCRGRRPRASSPSTVDAPSRSRSASAGGSSRSTDAASSGDRPRRGRRSRPRCGAGRGGGRRRRARCRGRRRACGRRCPTSTRPSARYTSGSAVGATSKRCTVTGRASRSTSIPGPGQLVQPLAADLHRRDHRRHLHGCRRRTAAGRPPATSSTVDARHVVGRGHLARGVEGGGLDAEHDLALVGLARAVGTAGGG